MPMLPNDLIDIAHACQNALRPAADADWSVKAGTLDWDCRQTLLHMVSAPMFYSINLAMRSTTPLRGLGVASAETPIATLIELAEYSSTILARLASEAPSDARGCHPAGMADTEGFLAMAGNELMNHAYDITSGLNSPFAPPGELAEKVLRRLFPWSPRDTEPWPTLLWAAGRCNLPGHGSQEADWWVQCAPLSEWNGRIRKRAPAPPAR
ncbi:MAG: hypothetical protein ACRDHX_16250 [Chloroflexota bacterium]